MNESDQLFQRVADVLSDVLGLPAKNISRDMSPDTNEAWDSMRHLNIVMAIEEEFSVTFSPEEQMEMISSGLIADLLAEKFDESSSN